MKRHVFIVGGRYGYAEMYEKRGWGLVNEVLSADLVQFTGGEDVSPSLYGHGEHPKTYSNPQRDRREAVVFRLCRELNMPMAGICRGGQFLNVMCGGTLWQDVPGHGINGHHTAIDAETGETFYVTSTHHQMMEPSKTSQYRLVLYSNITKWKEKRPVSQTIRVCDPTDVDVEALFYPVQRAFCFQPHPEFEGQDRLADRYFYYLDKYLFSLNKE